MITSQQPTTWQDLQNQVAQILSECGFLAEVGKVIRTVRGEVEIDVYAVEVVRSRSYEILCECKYWKNRIPQSVVHGFRTVVVDKGAHKGYIISSAGFQSGSHTAAELTNIEVVTWEEFQNEFEQTWLENYFAPTITETLDPLMTFLEPFPPSWFSGLPTNDQAEWRGLLEKYTLFGVLLMFLSQYPRMLKKHKDYPSLPLSLVSIGDFPDADKISQITGYRELLDCLWRIGLPLLAKFRDIRDRNGLTGGE